MKKPLDTEQAYKWAASRCAQQEICRQELLQKLLQKGLTRTDADTIADRLEAEDYIDEARYARAFVHDKTLFDRWGRIKTRQALHMKNVSDDHIEAALGTIDEDAYRQTLADLLAAKARTLDSQGEELRRKLVRFAAGRGFEPDIVFAVLA